MSTKKQSAPWRWNWKDTRSFLKGLGISMGAAALTYALGVVETSDLSPLWVSLLSNAINILQLYVKGEK